MKAILRLRESVHDIEAGSLMALGAELKPDADALQRVARRVGVSTTALAAAQAAAVKAAAEGGAAATTANTTALGKGVGSVLALSVIKGVAIGVCLSGAAYLAVHLPKASTRPNPVTLQAPMRYASPKPAESMAAVGAVSPLPSGAPDQGARVSSPHRGSTTPSKPELSPATAGTSESKETRLHGQLDEVPERTAAEPPPLPRDTTSPTVGMSAATSAFVTEPSASARSVDARVMREVVSLDRARALVKQGNATLALRELDEFNRVFGYRVLANESMLVRVDVLLSLGMRQAAAGVARQLLDAGAPATQRQRLVALANSSATTEALAPTLK